MHLLQAIILGIVEGLTEFLPISSTSHLILTNKLLGLQNSPELEVFNVVIQGAAILAVITIYTKKILTNPRLLLPLVLAFTPVAIAGLTAELLNLPLQDSPNILFLSTLIVGIFMLFWNRLPLLNQNKISSLDQINIKTALLIGLIHCLALIPGFSRAGAAILGGLIAGADRKTAIEFSFLLALPTLLSASVLKLSTGLDLIPQIWPPLLIGSLTALITSLIAMRLFLNLTRHLSWTTFGIYRIIFAFVFLSLI